MILKGWVERMLTAKGIDFEVKYNDDGDDFIDFQVFAKIENINETKWMDVTEIIHPDLLEEIRQTAWEERGTE
jgi:hypothetical protein